MVGQGTRLGALTFMMLAVTLSGCANGQFSSYSDGNQIAIAGQGQKSGVEHKEIDCGEKATISLAGQGQGSMTVTVHDGLGQEVFHKTFRGSEQGAEHRDLDGGAGTWRLTVDFGAALGVGAWQGQYAIHLRC